MSGKVKAAAEMLTGALKLIPRLPNHTDIAAPVDPPCTVLGPPDIRWEGPGHAPTSARFPVYIVEVDDSGAVERLWDLAEVVAEAIDETDAVIDPANPGLPSVYPGAAPLPCYLLSVEVALND